jgi:Mg2+ and Co2+ transporter CorA
VLSAEFGLHPQAVENAVHEHQRPKLDRYRSHLFLAAYAVQLDETSWSPCSTSSSTATTGCNVLQPRR